MYYIIRNFIHKFFEEEIIIFHSIDNFVPFVLLLFAGGFIDSIAGGGGLLTLPAYLLTGLPTVSALATNKFSSIFGTFGSFLGYLKHNKLHLKLLKFLVPASFAGSMLGSFIVTKIKADFLNAAIPFLILGVGLYSLFTKSLAGVSMYKHPKKAVLTKGIFFTFLVGFYDGFFGPGAGTFFIVMLIKIFSVDFLEASGNTKLLNFASGLSAFFIFLINGKVNFFYGLIGTVAILLGSLAGTKLAIKKGVPFIRPVFLSVSFIIAIKMFYDKLLH